MVIVATSRPTHFQESAPDCDNWFIAVEESHHCQGPDHQDAHDGDGHEAAARGFLALHIALVHTLHTKVFLF